MEFYKDRKNVEFKVGIFSIIGILILVLSYMWFTEFTETRKYTEISVKFSEANGVEVGSPVTIFGIKKGRVKKIEIDATGVILDLQVILDFLLPQDSQFFIDDTDLMGDAEIEIKPGNSVVELDYTILQLGSGQFGMSKIFVEIGDMILDLKVILKQLNQEDGLISSTKSVLDSSKIFVSNLNKSYKTNEDKIDNVIENVELLTSDIKLLVEENSDDLNNSVDDLLVIFKSTEETLAELKSTSQKIGAFTENLQEGEGTAQSLLQDKELFLNLKKSAASLDSLLSDIKDDPKKYFKFSVF